LKTNQLLDTNFKHAKKSFSVSRTELLQLDTELVQSLGANVIFRGLIKLVGLASYSVLLLD
jgi:hypothetical protein